MGFDPFSTTIDMNIIWAKLLGLPIELFNEVTIQRITERMGSFLFWDGGRLGQMDKRMERVPVDVNFGNGLLEELEIKWGQYSILISIDYWEIPFRCFLCHETRHLCRECGKRFSDGKDFESSSPVVAIGKMHDPVIPGLQPKISYKSPNTYLCPSSLLSVNDLELLAIRLGTGKGLDLSYLNVKVLTLPMRGISPEKNNL